MNFAFVADVETRQIEAATSSTRSAGSPPPSWPRCRCPPNVRELVLMALAAPAA